MYCISMASTTKNDRTETFLFTIIDLFGHVINSASYGTPHAAIAIPVYSQDDNSGSLIGVLVGGLNFYLF
jgi:hypothetical protein